MGWERYRLYRLRDRSRCSSRETIPCGPEVPTHIIIKARSQKEAEKKLSK